MSRDATKRFSDRAGSYDRGRPGYPTELILLNVVAAGQAAHWFNMPGTHLEFARILRPGGHVMLVWNRRHTSSAGWSGDYEALLVQWGTDYQAVAASWDVERSLEVLFGGKVRGHAVLEYRQTLDRPGLRARVTSSSYMPGAQDPTQGPMLDDLNELFDRHQTGGRVALDYDTHVYWSQIQE